MSELEALVLRPVKFYSLFQQTLGAFLALSPVWELGMESGIPDSLSSCSSGETAPEIGHFLLV